MIRSTKIQTMWGLGLGPEAIKELTSLTGGGYKLRNWLPGSLPTRKDFEQESPFLAWFTWDAWNSLSQREKNTYSRFDSMQKVLVVNGELSEQGFEAMLETGFMACAQYPLEPQKVQAILERATEITSLYADIYHMTREIYLERELLARKNDYLSFINQFLTRASESLDPATILENARKDLEMILPVKLLQGALWRPSKQGGLEATLFLNNHRDEATSEAWVDFLLESAPKLTGQEVDGFQISPMDVPETGSDNGSLQPHPGQVMVLPLSGGKDNFGCLALFTGGKIALGRDQVQLLHSAVNHLGVVLKNGMLYDEVRTQADFDGLTRIHNRRHFDVRLQEELNRHSRYNQNMTLLLLDLDHFKLVNDTYGHQAGDLVLKEVGEILRATARNTDYVARYGGEEFVALLPQTDADQAWILAERLRKVIEAQTIIYNNHEISITVSIGIASLRPGSLEPETNLLEEADRALYQAKTCGRNMIFTSGSQECPSLEQSVSV